MQASAYELLSLGTLTNLEIDIHHAMQWATFPELLGHMPNLKLFVLNKVISSVILHRWFCVLLLASSKYFDLLLFLL